MPVIDADKVIDLAKGGPHADVDNGVLTPIDLEDKDESTLEEGETMSVAEEETYSPVEHPLKVASPEVGEQESHQPVVKTVTKPESEETLEPIENKYGEEAFVTPNPTVQGLSPEQLIGRSFLLPQIRDGTRQ